MEKGCLLDQKTRTVIFSINTLMKVISLGMLSIDGGGLRI